MYLCLMIRQVWVLGILLLGIFSPALTQIQEIEDADDWGLAELDTGKNTDFMTDREKKMLKEINMVRTNPKRYISFVEKYIESLEYARKNFGELKSYSVRTVTTKVGTNIRTLSDTTWHEFYAEEIAAARELIEELTTMKPVPVLQPHLQLYVVAKQHGQTAKTRGYADHKGTYESQPWDRIRQGTSFKDGDEVLSNGPHSIRHNVISALVDSQNPDRANRRIMLDLGWTHLGCYETGQVGEQMNCWVKNFAR